MAIANETHGSDGAGGVDTGKTVAATVTSANAMFAMLYDEQNGGTRTVTYNGVGMTQIVSFYDTLGNATLSIFFLASPSSGTHNIVSSFSTTVYNQLYFSTYTGADTATPSSSGHNEATGTSISVTGLTSTGSAWFVAVGRGTTPVSGTTNLTLLDTANPTFQASFDSNGTVSSGTATISANAGRIALAAVSFQPTPVASSQVLNYLSLLGVGQ